MIGLAELQLGGVGFHLGHLLSESKFFIRWMLQLKGVFLYFKGFKKLQLKYEIFIINIKLTVLAIKSIIELGKDISLLGRRAWFVCHNYYFAPLVSRYAISMGIGYSIFDWISGCLTNMKQIFIYVYSLYLDWIRGFKLMTRHKKFFFRLWGFSYSGFFKPFLVLFSRLYDCMLASSEVGKSDIISAGLVDSNVIGIEITIPIPGNDDSIACLNLFHYLLAKSVVQKKFLSIKNWNKFILKFKKKHYLFNVIFINNFSCIKDWWLSATQYFKVVNEDYLSFFRLLKNFYFSKNLDLPFFKTLKSFLYSDVTRWQTWS